MLRGGRQRPSVGLEDPNRPKNPTILHDAAEAYTGDIISPVKALVPGFAEIEQRLDVAICEHFGVNPEALHYPEVKRADLIVLSAEAMVHLPEHEWHRYVSPDPSESTELAYFMRSCGSWCADEAAEHLRDAFNWALKEHQKLIAYCNGGVHEI